MQGRLRVTRMRCIIATIAARRYFRSVGAKLLAGGGTVSQDAYAACVRAGRHSTPGRVRRRSVSAADSTFGEHHSGVCHGVWRHRSGRAAGISGRERLPYQALRHRRTGAANSIGHRHSAGRPIRRSFAESLRTKRRNLSVGAGA
ncbi:hypothetical protein G6F65_019970 [Rhizopus arrhizus]|nr:hypothetical protein G6F65_019970 [Rhizopus arrhizus]